MNDENLPDWAKPAADDLPDWAKKPSAPPVATPREARKEAAAVRKPTKTEDAGGVGSSPAGLVGLGENALSMATAAGSGVAGALTAAATAPFIGVDRALNKGADVVRAGTYEPRTQSGKDIAQLLAAPIEAGGKVLGGIGADVAGSMAQSAGASPQTQAKIAAAGETIGENIIPIGMAAAPLPGAMKKAFSRTPEPMGPPRPREITPEQRARYDRLTKEGYEPTLGQTLREPEQFRFEEHTAQRGAGKDLLERKVEQNDRLAKNVEKQYPVGTTKLPDSAVGDVARKAIETKVLAKKAEIKAKYDKARDSGETKELVDVTSIVEYLKDTAPESVAVPALNSIQAKLKKLMPKAEGPTFETRTTYVGGKPVVKQIPIDKPAEAIRISIDDLENLRKAAGQLRKPGDPSWKFMGDVQQLIDTVTEGKGGDLYKAARKARREFGQEFEDQGGVARVIDKATPTDHKIDASQLWEKTVKNGTVEDLNQMLTTLKRDVRPGDKATASADQAAIKGLQRKTMEHVLEETTKSATADARGNPAFSPAKMKSTLDGIGREKLESLWGKAETDRLYKISEDAIQLKTAPERVAGSTTMSNAQMLTDKVFTNRFMFALEHLAQKTGIPFVRGALQWVREQVVTYKDKQFTKASVDEALNPMRESAAKTAQRKAETDKIRRQIAMKEGVKSLKAPAAALLMKDKQRNAEP